MKVVTVQTSSSSPRKLLCCFMTLLIYSDLFFYVNGIPKNQQSAASCEIDGNGVEVCQSSSVEAKEDHVKQRNRFKPPVDSTFRAWEESHGYGASSKDRFGSYNTIVDDYDQMTEDKIEPLGISPLVKGVCPQDGSIPNCKSLTGSTGAAQTNDSSANTLAINKLIQNSESYLKHKVLVDPVYRNIANRCINRHELCSFWASLEECENNPGYMLESCSLACLSCEPK